MTDGDASNAKRPRLSVRNLQAWYGESHVLHGVDLEVNSGEVVSLMGRNGAGKTTTLKSIMGMMEKREGSILFDQQETIGMRSFKIGRKGLAYCPENRGIFKNLTVAENLLLPPVVRSGGMSVAQLHEIFPNLKERSRAVGSSLSGGEQQMLAIARILRTGADFFLLDEPTEGLEPIIVKQIERLIHLMKQKALTVLLVEQSLQFCLSVADRMYILENGRIVDQMTREDVRQRSTDLQKYLGV